MNWSPLDYATAGVGLLFAAGLFPIFFKGFASFWEDFTEYGGSRSLSMGQSKIILWLMLAAGGAYSARYNLPHWFPHFFQ